MAHFNIARLVYALLTLVAALPFVLGRAVSPAQIESRATIPSEDPFYQPPEGFESKPPGAILRQRKIISSFFGLLPAPIETHQLLYRTSAIDGSPIATVTTIFKPLLAKKDQFVVFNTAYDSSATICNPSYQFQLGTLQTNVISAAEFLLIQAYLLKGYTVASPDYEGPEAAFSPGRLAAKGILDGMRAVINFKGKLGLSESPSIVSAGYSGGAIANGWAASLHPTYAPELNVKGWISGGTPANLTGVLTYVDGGIVSGFLPGAIAGLSKETAYGATLKPVIDRIATERGREVLEAGNTNCAPQNLLTYAGESVLSTKFQSLGPGLLHEPTVRAVLDQQNMGVNKSETPTAPVFLYHAQDDEVIPFSYANELPGIWCGNGANVKFINYAAGGHVTTEVIALPEALQFTADAFADKIAGGCTSKTVLDDKLNPLALGLSLEPLVAGLANILLKAGKKDANIKQDIRNIML